MDKQSEFNIGTLGHVDHGKTTLTSAITHMWTDTHSESVKRSMTIKLGYADATISRCEGKEGSSYTTASVCADGSEAVPVRKISLLDSPGHETLMATAIAGSSIIDAVLFVISSAEPCPMPQTKEHLMIINALGIDKIIVVQTKIDVVGREKAKASYNQIRQFLKGSRIENAPIIPVMANKNVNVDAVLEEIMKLKIPERDIKSDPIMYVARSFDVNKPGTGISGLRGGVIGGSIIRGRFRIGDEIEIKPGMNTAKDKQKKENYESIYTKVESLSAGSEKLDEAKAGGLVAIGTEIDPALTKSDGLVGQVVGLAGKLPEALQSAEMTYISLNRSDIPKQAFKDGEPILLGIGTGTVIGYVKKARKDRLQVEFKHSVCIDKYAKISVLRNFTQRWRLSGYGVLR
ncbi:MAG: translation initiation factor IF-2 subunit gamma [Candidatus Micrarchaeaceae archaeon]